MIAICTNCAGLANEELAHECTGICPICMGVLKDIKQLTDAEWRHIERIEDMDGENRDEVRRRLMGQSCHDRMCGAWDCYACYGEGAVDAVMSDDGAMDEDQEVDQ